MTARVPTLIRQSHLEKHEGQPTSFRPLTKVHFLTYLKSVAWAAYWYPILQTLSGQCVNPCRDIRHHAISTLQRALLSAELISGDDQEWTTLFDEVLFPLILRLLKPEVYHSDPIGMSETRVQAATLVCKIFLRFLDQLPNREGMLPLWLQILDILDRMMNSGQSDSLEEAIPESLKNILLVMADGGYLVSPSQDPRKEEMWLETRKRLGRFLPDLFAEIFPDAGKEAEKSQPGSGVASPAKRSLDVTKESQDTATPATSAVEQQTAETGANESEPAPTEEVASS